MSMHFGEFADGIFEHVCEKPGCDVIVAYDDEPYCFVDSPDSGSSVPGYSARAKAKAQGDTDGGS